VTSSGLDRTLLSAGAFLEGAFPAGAADVAGPEGPAAAAPPPPRPPVYSSQDRGDWKIRGYTKCPAYEARLTEWFASDEFKAKEAASAGLRAAVGGLNPGLDVSLKNWWNGAGLWGAGCGQARGCGAAGAAAWGAPSWLTVRAQPQGRGPRTQQPPPPPPLAALQCTTASTCGASTASATPCPT
jgi:hypothetical protein